MAQPTGTSPQISSARRAITSLWRILIRFDAHRVSRWMGLRNALGVALPVAVLIDLGHPAFAVVAGMGALNVAAADGTNQKQIAATGALSVW